MQVAFINVSIFLLSLLIGLIFTLFCKFSQRLHRFKIQGKRPSTFRLQKHFKLIFTNILIISILSVVTVSIYNDYFSLVLPKPLIFCSQFLIIMLLDDVEFYLWHRFLHSNNFMMKHIHAIHHRARVPYPIEFIYAHPLEWLGGMLGIVVAILLIIFTYGTLNAYVLFAYTAYRTLRELDIHSNLEPQFLKYLPFLCSSKHHSLHHSNIRGNFASTFTYLDKLFKTQL